MFYVGEKKSETEFFLLRESQAQQLHLLTGVSNNGTSVLRVFFASVECIDAKISNPQKISRAFNVFEETPIKNKTLLEKNIFMPEEFKSLVI